MLEFHTNKNTSVSRRYSRSSLSSFANVIWMLKYEYCVISFSIILLRRIYERAKQTRLRDGERLLELKLVVDAE